MTAAPRCVIDHHPHPGRECRDPRDVHRNRWGGAPAKPVPELPDGQLDLLVDLDSLRDAFDWSDTDGAQ